MFALALKKKALVCEAMSRGTGQDCQSFALLIAAYADFHELRREKMLALEDVIEDHKMDFDELLEATGIVHNGYRIFINEVFWNCGGFHDHEETSGLRWRNDDCVVYYRVPSMPDGECGSFNGGDEPANALMTHLEKNLVCELCGYLVGRYAVEDPDEVVERKLCGSCALGGGIACKTCGLSCGMRRLKNGEHRECKRRKIGQ